MNSRGHAFVSVVTPVYNGEEYLSQCIESVLSQTYQNWEYVIVNNCSTDRTLEIAQAYASKDQRIRVHSNQHFAPVIENHNIALRQISPQSKYCKVVFADDWLFPQCFDEMVKVAEAYPSVGIVGAYGQDGVSVLWQGLPQAITFVPGRELCRWRLLGGAYIFGSPTSLLMRSDLVRHRNPFYDEASLHADHEVCFELLLESDFGFVHQILTYTRSRPDSNNVFAQRIDSIVLGNLGVAVKYGHICLTPEESAGLKEAWLEKYYSVLAKSVLRLRDKEYWEYHKNRLNALECPLDRRRLANAVVREIFAGLLRPIGTIKGALNWWPRRFKDKQAVPSNSDGGGPRTMRTTLSERSPLLAKNDKTAER